MVYEEAYQKIRPDLLRLQNKPIRFIAIEMTNATLILSLNVWWIGFQGLGIEYIFINPYKIDTNLLHIYLDNTYLDHTFLHS